MKAYIKRFNQVKEKYIDFIENSDNSKLRIRDISNNLGISEAELLSVQIGNKLQFLEISNFSIFFSRILSEVDKLMFLIRSDFAVHEKIISTKDYKFDNDAMLNKQDNGFPLIQFNINFFSYIFYEVKKHNNQELRSFQFFDDKGYSVLKIYLKDRKIQKFDLLASDYKIKYNYQLQKNISQKLKKNIKLDSINYQLDLFNPNLGTGKKTKVSNTTLRKILNALSEKSISIQIHAFGIGCVQYHRGVIKNVIDYGPWLNVMDKNFNLHILENKIFKSFLVNYNVKNKLFYSVDFYDINNNFIIGVSAVSGFEKEFYEIIDI
tara:strand:+ start:534 stop:1496 length:963 start_codon:yes stop_codon:yes gene_type:complete